LLFIVIRIVSNAYQVQLIVHNVKLISFYLLKILLVLLAIKFILIVLFVITITVINVTLQRFFLITHAKQNSVEIHFGFRAINNAKTETQRVMMAAHLPVRFNKILLANQKLHSLL
jgi:capsular polysaccharide biosynthesis protein